MTTNHDDLQNQYEEEFDEFTGAIGEYLNINEALPDLVGMLLDEGSKINGTHESLFVNFKILEPDCRFISNPGRKYNPFAQCAETLWVLAGRNDVETLGWYLPRASEFSDDGVSWRAGYGRRLFNATGNLDQILGVLQTLRDNPSSRQAVVTIWDPLLDNNVKSKDIPCNNWLHFIIRNNKLHLNVVVRSNDVIWGFSGINLFEWSVLLSHMASLLGVNVGVINWNVTSFHMYDRHIKQANNIVENEYDFYVDGAAICTNSTLQCGLLNNFQTYYELKEQLTSYWLAHATYLTYLSNYPTKDNHLAMRGYIMKLNEFVNAKMLTGRRYAVDALTKDLITMTIIYDLIKLYDDYCDSLQISKDYTLASARAEGSELRVVFVDFIRRQFFHLTNMSDSKLSALAYILRNHAYLFDHLQAVENIFNPTGEEYKNLVVSNAEKNVLSKIVPHVEIK